MINKRKFVRNLKDQNAQLREELSVIEDRHKLEMNMITLKYEQNVRHLRAEAMKAKAERTQFANAAMTNQAALDEVIVKMKEYDDIVKLLQKINEIKK